jgi:hypothetical protein
MDKKIVVGLCVVLVVVALGYAWHQGYLNKYLPVTAQSKSKGAAANFTPTPSFAQAVKMSAAQSDAMGALSVVALEMAPWVVTTTANTMKMTKDAVALRKALDDTLTPVGQAYVALGVAPADVAALQQHLVHTATAASARLLSGKYESTEYFMELTSQIFPAAVVFAPRRFKSGRGAITSAAAQAVGLVAWWSAHSGGDVVADTKKAADIGAKMGADGAALRAAAVAAAAIAPAVVISGKPVDLQMMDLVGAAMSAALQK